MIDLRRFTRLEKYRQKNQPLIIVSKVAVICYLMIFSVSYLTASTEAYFASPEQVSKINITTGIWVDESSFVFNETGNEQINACPAVIEVEVENDGDGPMLAEGSYEIYYAEDGGDPLEDGIKLELDENEGIIEILEVGETTKLTYETSDPGVYMFVTYKHDIISDEDRFMSEEIIVECEDEQPEDEQNNDQTSTNKQDNENAQKDDEEQSEDAAKDTNDEDTSIENTDNNTEAGNEANDTNEDESTSVDDNDSTNEGDDENHEDTDNNEVDE